MEHEQSDSPIDGYTKWEKNNYQSVIKGKYITELLIQKKLYRVHNNL